MKGNYEACLAETLKWEGGWSDHPADPGGATMRGVTQAVYDKYRRGRGLAVRSVRGIEEGELQAIYRGGYWATIGGDQLAKGLDCSAFDLSVNSGPGRARQYIAATDNIPGIVARIKAFNAKRRSFLQGLRTFSVFGKGWMRRVAAIEALSLKMAMASDAVGKSVVKEEAKRSGKVADNATKGAGGAATGGAATGGATVAVDHTWGWLEYGIAVLVVLAIAGLVWTAYAHLVRKEEFEKVAEQ